MQLQTKYHQILVKGMRQRIIPNKTKEARDWFRKAAQEMSWGRHNVRDFIKAGGVNRPETSKNNITIGAMYLFNYDPKYKRELPVYDTFPLVIFFNQDAKHLWGINFHYLPMKERAQLMDILYTISSDKKYGHKTKIQLSWQILKGIADKKLYKDAVHCYLKSHIKSKMKYILPIEWDVVLCMPVARFYGPQAAKYNAYQKR